MICTWFKFPGKTILICYYSNCSDLQTFLYNIRLVILSWDLNPSFYLNENSLISENSKPSKASFSEYLDLITTPSLSRKKSAVIISK